MAKKTKEPKAGKAPKGEGPGKKGGKGKTKKPKEKGRLLGKVTNLVAVLFALSLVADQVVEVAAAAQS